jgi:hypothetical protein
MLHQSLTCTAVDTNGRYGRSCHGGVFGWSQHQHWSVHNLCRLFPYVYIYTYIYIYIYICMYRSRCCTSCPLLRGAYMSLHIAFLVFESPLASALTCTAVDTNGRSCYGGVFAWSQHQGGSVDRQARGLESVENLPAWQSLHPEAPAPAYLPDPQSLIRQVEDDQAPTAGEYVPAAQHRHGSVQTPAASSSGAALAALCCISPCWHRPPVTFRSLWHRNWIRTVAWTSQASGMHQRNTMGSRWE